MEDTSKRHTRELKILKYIASLIEFYVFQQNGKNRLPPLSKTKSAFYGTSPIVVEGFYRRFAEVRSGTQAKDKAERYTVSPRLESKLLYYLAVLCLMVDRYDVDLFDLKHDLNIMPREYVLLELMCISSVLTNYAGWRRHSSRWGAPSESSGSTKSR